MEASEFNRSKIYETLDYQPEPENYSSNVPWVVQQQIAATNGKHYIDLIGKIGEYPIFSLPVEAVRGDRLMLDIGCGWGRWLVAGHDKGYIPIGIDLRLEFCKTSRRVASDLGRNGYAVVADLENIPFIDSIFDLVWSFSVIQHTHLKRLENCLFHIERILTNDGYSFLEFPNSNGIRNRFGPVKASRVDIDNYNSWAVRYYSPSEYNAIFNRHLANFEYFNHSFIGIGVLKEDLRYVSMRNKILCTVSLLGSLLTDILPSLKRYSDSIYIRSSKLKTVDRATIELPLNRFLELHKENPEDNLNVIHLLRCPLTGNSLSLSHEKDKLLNYEGGFYYPIVDGIPILISDERQSI